MNTRSGGNTTTDTWTKDSEELRRLTFEREVSRKKLLLICWLNMRHIRMNSFHDLWLCVGHDCATLKKREWAFRGLESHEFTMQGIQESFLKRESDVSCLRRYGECYFRRNCEWRNSGKFQGVACCPAKTSEPHDCEWLEQISERSSSCPRALDHTHTS